VSALALTWTREAFVFLCALARVAAGAGVAASASFGCGDAGRPVSPAAPVETVAIPPAPVSSGPFLDVAPPSPTDGPTQAMSVSNPTTDGGIASSKECAPFDRGAAARTLGSVNVQRCKRAGGPTGPGHVTITFEPTNGRVISVVVDSAPFSGTPEGACVAAQFRTVAVPRFCGPQSIAVGKSFALP
jgi:hypothetical protein